MTRSFKTVDEFIISVMSGKKWEYNKQVFHYDNREHIPFRIDNVSLVGEWLNITIQEFTLVEPEPETESWAQFRVYDLDADCWISPNRLYRTLKDFQEEWSESFCTSHHEIEGSRVMLPKLK